MISMTYDWGISCEIAFRWMPSKLTNESSILVLVLSWCRRATSHLPEPVLTQIHVDTWHHKATMINTLMPRQNGRDFADDTFKRIFLNENVKISLKFVPKGPINNIPALVQIMAWRRPGDKPLYEPMMDNLPTHICVTRPQWVKMFNCNNLHHFNAEERWETQFVIHTHLFQKWFRVSFF